MKLHFKWPDSVPLTEVNQFFIQGMFDRLSVGFFNYGPKAKDFPKRSDAIASLKLRLKEYERTGNTEFLMDVANYAEIEFSHPKHPKAHYVATDKRQSPGQVLNRRNAVTNRRVIVHENEDLRS